MKITPQRAELIMEAVQLRKFGWTQQQIADDLNIPQRTISRWLNHNGYATSNNLSQDALVAKHYKTTLATSITLFPYRYEQVTEREIPPESIDLVLTDPPYLVSSADISRNNQNDLQRDFGKWDKTSQEDYANSVALWAKLMASQLKPGGSLYLFMGHRLLNLWLTNLEQCGLSDNGLLIWHRNNPAPQIRQTRWCPAFDMVLFFSKGSPKTFRWLGQNEMHNVISGGICAGIEREWSHPTQKPRWLLRKLLRVSSRQGDTILDPFAGSGSTAFASFELPSSRHVILIEPEPKYAGLIQSIAKEEFQCEVTLKDN